jgi:hypothetical protein
LAARAPEPVQQKPAERTRAGEDEPDLPASVSQPLYCLTPDEAPPGVEIPMRCVPGPGLTVAKMVLFYRTPGRNEFTAVNMSRSPKGWYRGTVPPSSAGKALQYYIEARGPGNKVASSNGEEESPNLVLIRDESESRLAADEAPASARDDENPLALAEEEHARAVEERSTHRRARDAFWLGVGVGSGYGWHPARRLEFHDDLQMASGVSPAGLLQISPEIGRQFGARYALSLQARLQVIPESGSGDNRAGAPAHTALAVFLRGHRFYGLGNAQLFLTGTIGGGQGFRLVVPPDPESGVDRSDTVRAGPFVAGPGAGFIYHFSRHFAWALELRTLVGFPDLAALGELSTGGSLAF